MPATSPPKKHWTPSYHDKSSVLRMAEPQHRLGPLGVSSGTSAREADMPVSSVQQVKNICLFYVKKCSGKYIDNKTAARYVHQMADEVIGQLSGVTAQIRRYEIEPEIYQGLLNDWKDVFPPSLGAAGTPKAIAAKLARQQMEITKLQSKLTVESENHKREMTDILRSMDSQLVAYRDGIMNERCQIAVTHEYQLNELEAKLDNAHIQMQQELDRVAQVHLDELENLRRQYENQLGIMKEKLQSSEVRTEEREHEFQEFVETLNEQHLRELARLRQQINVLEERAIEHSGILAAAGDDSQSVVSLTLDATFDDSFDLTDITSETSEPDDTELSASSASVGAKSSASATKRIARRREISAMRKKIRADKKQKRKEAKDAAKEEHRREKAAAKAAMKGSEVKDQQRQLQQPKKKKSIRLTGAVADGVKALKTEIDELKNIKSTNEAIIVDLESKMKRLSEENDLLSKRMKELENINDELRKALRLMLEQSKNYQSHPERVITSEPFELTHTPHFLGPKDTSGPLKNQMQHKISGYPPVESETFNLFQFSCTEEKETSRNPKLMLLTHRANSISTSDLIRNVIRPARHANACMDERELFSQLTDANLFETDGDYVISVDLPGVKPEDIHVSISSRAVVIKAERKNGYIEDDSIILQCLERSFGTVRKTILLPLDADPNTAEVKLDLGVLSVKLKKSTTGKLPIKFL